MAVGRIPPIYGAAACGEWGLIAILKLLGFLLVVQTAFYLMIAAYARSIRREHLESAFAGQGGTGDRDAFIAAGMAEYRRSLRHRLLWLVYILPILAVVTTAYMVNHG